MKRALALIVLLVSCSLAFANDWSEVVNAPSGVFARILSPSDVDLATTSLYSVQLDFPESENPKILVNGAGSNIDWQRYRDDETYFSDSSMIGYAGVTDFEPTSITFSRNGPDYMFYNTDFSGYRPYGILYVLKGANLNSEGNSLVETRLMVGMVGYHNDSSSFVPSSSSAPVTIYLPSTEDSYTEGRKYYWDGNNDLVDRGDGSGTHYKYYWLDLVLILNPRVDTTTNKLSGRTDTTYCLMRDGDDYRASFNVNIGGRSVAFAIGGYYNTTYNSEDHPYPAYLTVNPTAAATNLNLKKEFTNGNTVKIGEYTFSTQTVDGGNALGDSAPTYYFSVSSSPMGEANDSPFFIRHVVADKNNTNPINGFYFEIGLESNQGNGTVWYDGTFTDAATMVSSGTNGTNYISPKVIEETTTRKDQWAWNNFHWEDSGDIKIRLNTNKSNESDLEQLRSGRYTATIYFNVYSGT